MLRGLTSWGFGSRVLRGRCWNLSRGGGGLGRDLVLRGITPPDAFELFGMIVSAKTDGSVDAVNRSTDRRLGAATRSNSREVSTGIC